MVLKNRKLLKGSRHKNSMGILGEDKISGSPDPLHHILCFLPAKCAACTSILSKRWRNVWNTIPILDFRNWRSTRSSATVQDRRLESERFMNFVERMLSLHDDMPNIQKFDLCCDEWTDFDESRVNVWISTLVTRKVEELIISIFMIKSSLFPSCFFTCDSLTIVELEVDTVLNIPESISFPKLKILRLRYITFVDENLTRQFFSNCPVLEELKISCCRWMNMEALCISAPALRHLFIDALSEDGLDSLDNCEVKIYVPSLYSLQYYGSVAKDYVLHGFPPIADAVIDLMDIDDDWRTKEKIGYSASKLLGGLSNVKFLSLSGETFRALSFADDPLTNLPTFYNLIHFKVTLLFPYSNNRTLLELLQIAPNLETLVFDEGFNQCVYTEDDSWALNLMAPCLLRNLKSVEFGRFYGNSRELIAVKLLLKNAEVLQKITIFFSSELSTDLRNRVMEQLLKFPRGSINCVIKFW